MTCHDSETKVLVNSGWKRFRDLTSIDLLATIDPSTRSLTYEAPTRLIRYPYVGELVCAKNRSLDFRVTPNHLMLVRKWDQHTKTLKSDYALVPAKDLGWYSGLLNNIRWGGGDGATKEYVLNGVKCWHTDSTQGGDLTTSMRLWLRFLGIYLAEGTLLKPSFSKTKSGYAKVGTKRGAYKIQLAASKEREKSFIRATLAEFGVKALELEDRFTFSNQRIWTEVTRLGLNGVRAPQKFVPGFVFQQSAESIKDFLLGHFMGDGSEQNGVKSHYTSSVRLAEDLHRLVFLSGSEVGLSIREARESLTGTGRIIRGEYPEHRISVRSRKTLSIERKNQVFKEMYSGEVFGAEVPTHHTLVTNRNGKVLILGDCT